MLWLCEGCGTLYAVGLFRCPHCHSTHFHEFGSKPEDEEHPMAKITRHGGVTNAVADAAADAAAVVVEAPEEAGEAALEDLEKVAEVERPSARAARAEWLEWAAAAGYHGPCVEALTVPQIQALPDGPPVYDDDGLLVTPEDASEETAAAVELYNAKALELYTDPEDETEPADVVAEAEAPADEEEDDGAEDVSDAGPVEG